MAAENTNASQLKKSVGSPDIPAYASLALDHVLILLETEDTACELLRPAINVTDSNGLLYCSPTLLPELNMY